MINHRMWPTRRQTMRPFVTLGQTLGWVMSARTI